MALVPERFLINVAQFGSKTPPHWGRSRQCVLAYHGSSLYPCGIRDGQRSLSMLAGGARSEVPGWQLEEVLNKCQQGEEVRRSISPQERRALCTEAYVCAGQLVGQLAPIIEAFSAKVYHRDITPRNIQVAPGRGFGLGALLSNIARRAVLLL